MGGSVKCVCYRENYLVFTTWMPSPTAEIGKQFIVLPAWLEWPSFIRLNEFLRDWIRLSSLFTKWNWKRFDDVLAQWTLEIKKNVLTGIKLSTNASVFISVNLWIKLPLFSSSSFKIGRDIDPNVYFDFCLKLHRVSKVTPVDGIYLSIRLFSLFSEWFTLDGRRLRQGRGKNLWKRVITWYFFVYVEDLLLKIVKESAQMCATFYK